MGYRIAKSASGSTSRTEPSALTCTGSSRSWVLPHAASCTRRFPPDQPGSTCRRNGQLTDAKPGPARLASPRRLALLRSDGWRPAIGMSADDVHQDLTDTIVLIHGLWLTALSWEHWIGRYRARGYRILAPNWPGLDATIEELRRKPSAMARLGVTEIADHYDHLVRDLGHPPVIVGHSVGGLAAQILLDRGLGAAGVSIAPAPAKGAMARPIPLLRADLAALRLLRHDHAAIPLTSRQFRRVVTNTL